MISIHGSVMEVLYNDVNIRNAGAKPPNLRNELNQRNRFQVSALSWECDGDILKCEIWEKKCIFSE